MADTAMPKQREVGGDSSMLIAPWRRHAVYEVTKARIVEMECCGFRFDAVHFDEDGGYSCPECGPGGPSHDATCDRWADEALSEQV